MQYIRHGDVVLQKVDSIPSDAVPMEHNGQIILAEGEVTGHMHRLTASKDALKGFTKDGTIFFSLTIPAPLTHEEHKTIEVPSGVWRRVFEREWDYAQNDMRKVQD